MSSIMDHVATVLAKRMQCELNLRARRSIEYAKARSAIEEEVKEIWKSNQAQAKRFEKEAKKEVRVFLEGRCFEEIDSDKRDRIVMFPDKSIARY